ncbi:hypothetical protein ECARS42123_1203, partial [Escherichia coli ARS4.2123]
LPADNRFATTIGIERKPVFH